MSDRTLKVAEQIRRELGELLREVRDPRVQEAQLLTITHVRVSDDLGVAHVLVSAIGGQGPEVVSGLNRARRFLQGQLGKRMHARKIPELRFVLDETDARADRVEAILREIGEEKPDAEHDAADAEQDEGQGDDR